MKRMTMLEDEECKALKELIENLRSEVHNPGYLRHIKPRFDLDRDCDDLVYMLDHALENAK